MDVGTCEDRLVSVRPALDAPVDKGHLCVKGRYAFEYVHAADRVTEPMIRERAGWRRTSWTEARAVVANGLRNLIDRHGPDSIGILASARATKRGRHPGVQSDGDSDRTRGQRMGTSRSSS